MKITGLERLDADLLQFVGTILAGVTYNVQNNKMLAPVAFLDTPQSFLPCLLAFGSPEEKEEIAARLRGLARENRSRFVMMALESWSVSVEGGNDIDRKKYPNVSDHPDAYECVLITVETVRHGSYIASVRIGKDRTLDDTFAFQSADGGGTGGRFMHMIMRVL